MTHIIMVTFHFSVSELWSFSCVLCLFCVIYILVHPITHSCNAIGQSEFSQDDVSGTRINVSPSLKLIVMLQLS